MLDLSVSINLDNDPELDTLEIQAADMADIGPAIERLIEREELDPAQISSLVIVVVV